VSSPSSQRRAAQSSDAHRRAAHAPPSPPRTSRTTLITLITTLIALGTTLFTLRTPLITLAMAWPVLARYEGWPTSKKRLQPQFPGRFSGVIQISGRRQRSVVALRRRRLRCKCLFLRNRSEIGAVWIHWIYFQSSAARARAGRYELRITIHYMYQVFSVRTAEGGGRIDGSTIIILSGGND
jgi:hypothetical protein